jgi:itaconate CoA-transferase
MTADPQRRPLEGLTVVALEQAVAAPFCTSRLADAGARVIKIERAEGDFARGYDRFAKGQSAYFVWLNRGKQSVVLDIKGSADRAWLKRMMVQNLAPGALVRAGLAVDELRAEHPRLITCSISGYGAEPPYNKRKAYDLLLQAETGMASITGTADAPGRIGVSGCDIACGLYAHAAILQALIARGTTGLGQAINVSLFDAMADWMAVPLMQFDGTGRGPDRVGLAHASIAPYGVYAAGDGAQVLLAIQNPREWTRFCLEVLEDPALATDPRFADNIARVSHRQSLDAAITARLSSYDRPSLIAALERASLAFGMLNTVADLAAHPHLRRAAIDTAGGVVTAPSPPAISDGETLDLGPVPTLGQHTEELRREFSAPD